MLFMDIWFFFIKETGSGLGTLCGALREKGNFNPAAVRMNQQGGQTNLYLFKKYKT